MEDFVDVTPEEAAKEVLFRRRARERLIDFARYTKHNYEADPFHELLANELDLIAKGENDRLMVFAPPQHGKSELTTRRFPAYFLARNPEKSVISASYNSDFATTFGREVRGIVQGTEFARLFPGVTIRSDNRSADEWQLDQGGKYFAVGVGGATTGKGAHCLTASARVMTSVGYVSIADLAHLRACIYILGYDHSSAKPVWKTCTAFSSRQTDGIYRITTASGRVVEATGEHPFFANGRYVEARFLASGDRLLRLVPKRYRENGLRIHEGREEWSPNLLLSGVSVECDAHPKMHTMPCADAEQVRTIQCQLLLGGVSEEKFLGEGLDASASGSRQDSYHRDEGMRVLQCGVQTEQQIATCPFLLQSLQGPNARFRNDGRCQSRVAERNESASATTSFSKGVSADEASHPGEGRACVRGLFRGKAASRTPHQHESIRQPVLESCHPVCELSSQASCGGAFETVEDLVAMVEFVCQPTTVYNISVDGTENFFAEDILTHNCFIIDDPIKNRKEADSELIRDDQWNWYRDVVYTRLQHGAAVVMTLTRWHSDDLAGRAIELMKSGRGKPWRIVRCPAICEPMVDLDGNLIPDPLGRHVGEALAPNRFTIDDLRDIEQTQGERSWSAMYQQRPIAAEGGMFKPAWFGSAIGEGDLPPNRQRVRAWDLASTLDGDFTVGVLMSKDKDGVFYIEHVKRFRGTPLDVETQILKTARDDGRSVSIRLPQDPGQAGKAQAANLIRKLAGFVVKAERMSGSKAVRAEPFAAQVEARNVRLVQGVWIEAFKDELSTFPLGAHDDQVDAASDAFNALLGVRKARILEW